MRIEQKFTGIEIRGKIALTKEEAKRLFNYDMKPGAIGVCIRKQNGKYTITSVMRIKSFNKAQKRTQKFIKILGKIFSESYPLIGKVWRRMDKYNPMASFTKYNSSFLRCKKVIWQKILLTVGTIPTPIIDKIIFLSPNIIKFKILNNKSGYKIGIILIDRAQKNFKIYNFDFREYEGDEIELFLNKNLGCKSPILYVFFEYKGEFSNSVCRAAKRR